MSSHATGKLSTSLRSQPREAIAIVDDFEARVCKSPFLDRRGGSSGRPKFYRGTTRGNDEAAPPDGGGPTRPFATRLCFETSRLVTPAPMRRQSLAENQNANYTL